MKIKNSSTQFSILISLFILFSYSLSAQSDTISYQWPYMPMTTQPNIGGTFGEYRSTSTSGHFHNGTDMSAPAGKPVHAVLPGTVAVAFHDGSTGYDSYVRIQSNVNGVTKHLTYYHTIPIVSVGQTIELGQQISTVAIDHVHLIEYRAGNNLSGTHINSLRPDGGVLIYNDPWKPNIRFVKFHLDGTSTQLPANSLGSRVDILVHVEEVNGTSTASRNNGTYKIGYKILSADTQSVVYNPPDDGLRFQYYGIPTNTYVNVNYYQPESNTSKHVYIITNGTGAANVAQTRAVQNGYWDVDDFPYGDYVVMVFTEDVRGNTDTVYVNVTTTDIDLIPPAAPKLESITRSAADSLHISWQAPEDGDLMGYRLFYSQNGINYNMRDDETILTNQFESFTYHYASVNPLYFKMFAVDTASFTNVSDQSKVYGIRMLNDENKILIVDGFNRFGGSGSWPHPYHDFVIKHAESFNLSFESASNQQVLNNSINLNDFELVIWILGDESSVDETFSSVEQAKVAAYLEGGGKLFVSGSEIAWDLEGSGSASASDTQFLRNYLKSKFIADNSNIRGVLGVDSTFFEGLGFSYGLVSQGSPYDEDYPDVIDTVGGSTPILKYNGITAAGIAYTGEFNNSTNIGQLIYIGLPFETIPLKQARTDLMTASLKYFGILSPTSVEDQDIQPFTFSLNQNYPNPFNPSTVIKFSIIENAHVTLTIYDVLGRKVKTLIDEEMSPGVHQTLFNAVDLSSGIYFYELRANQNISTKKMMLVK
jgi:hypothetical protein